MIIKRLSVIKGADDHGSKSILNKISKVKNHSNKRDSQTFKLK